MLVSKNVMKRLLKYLFTLLFCLCISLYSIGQKDSAKSRIYLWLSAGTCLTYTDNFNNLLGYRFAINSSINQKYFITFNYQLNYSINNVLSNPKSQIVTNLNNGSLLFGLGKFKYKSLAFIAATGISYGKEKYRGELLGSITHNGPVNIYVYRFSEDNYNYIGVPINLKILLTSPIIGLSLDLYANIHKHFDYGLIVSANIGRIRTNFQRRNEIDRK
jgi:hypothetical protein